MGEGTIMSMAMFQRRHKQRLFRCCSTGANKMATLSLRDNRCDLLYLVFFAIHILVMLGWSFFLCLSVCLV